jgi:hypothetical protein
MTNKESLAMVVAALVFSGSCCAAQPARHLADFKLAISTDQETVRTRNTAMNIVVTVKETNISKHIVNVGRTTVAGQWYTMSVLMDGHSAPLTEDGQRVFHPKKIDPDEGENFSAFLGTLKPGHSTTFEVPLSLYFNLASPGTYQVTFSRGTDLAQPDNVEVKSNTIIITVLAADDPSSVKPH